ncbi:hypothetical protein NDN08_001757 [Rhodosorus marinus]|uniref:Calmodulin-lysine N-methyltransferase n=1 Tax=Rhodosorus marinus TaxID=101924 RepID=A0AAV8URW0_9RHOD|nr:hypothetical protein NDN08_001757 [Rhodosorus marinus]
MSAGEGIERSWMMRNRTPKELYEDDYAYVSDCGIQLRFEQGGGARVVGQTTWDGAILLSKYFEHAQKTGSIDLSGMTVVELGSGTGLVGTVCAMLGANAILTDRPGVVTDLLIRNANRNISSVRGTLTVEALDWYIEEHVPKLLCKFPNVDFIVASEVIYCDALVHPLLNTLRELQKTGAELIMSHAVHRLAPLVTFLAETHRRSSSVLSVPDIELHPKYKAEGILIKRITPRLNRPEEVSSERRGIQKQKLSKLEIKCEQALRNLLSYQRLEYETFEAGCMVCNDQDQMDRFVDIQMEKARLIEQLGILESQTADFVYSVHENVVNQERIIRNDKISKDLQARTRKLSVIDDKLQLTPVPQESS